MNDHSKTILWLGLLMIVLQIVANWRTIRAVIFAGGSSPGGIPLIPPLGVPGKGKVPPGEPVPPEVPVPEVPPVLAKYIPASKG